MGCCNPSISRLLLRVHGEARSGLSPLEPAVMKGPMFQTQNIQFSRRLPRQAEMVKCSFHSFLLVQTVGTQVLWVSPLSSSQKPQEQEGGLENVQHQLWGSRQREQVLDCSTRPSPASSILKVNSN